MYRGAVDRAVPRDALWASGNLRYPPSLQSTHKGLSDTYRHLPEMNPLLFCDGLPQTKIVFFYINCVLILFTPFKEIRTKQVWKNFDMSLTFK